MLHFDFILKSSTKPCPLTPTAIPRGLWQLWLASLLYFIIGLVAFYGFFEAIRVKGVYYFRVSFLGASFLLCMIRGIQTLLHFPYLEDHMFSTYVFELFIPVYLQYWTYSLLILFVWRCQLIIRDHEQWVMRYLYPIYHSVQFLILVICFLIAYVLSSNWKVWQRKEWDRRPALVVAFLYFILCAFGVYFSIRAYHLLELAGRILASKLRLMGLMMSIYIVLFALRLIWNLTYFFSANPIQQLINDQYESCNMQDLAWAYLIFYGIFEIIPTAFVVYLVTLYIKPRSSFSSPILDDKHHFSDHTKIAYGSSDDFVDVSFNDSQHNSSDNNSDDRKTQQEQKQKQPQHHLLKYTTIM